MSYLKERFKKKRAEMAGTRLSVREVFKNEKGAIDLASIMVGIIVIGLIGGVIASTVFVVIPWAQDNAAKQQLDSVASAESAYMGMSSAIPSPLPAGYVANSFGNSAQLVAANLLQTGTTYCAVTPADGKSYSGYSKSASGSVWGMSDKNTQPALFTDTVPAECGFTSDVTPVTPPTTPPPYVDPTPTTTIMTYNCDVATTGSIPMSTQLTGTENWSDGTYNTYSNATGPGFRTFIAGKTYTLTFQGTYKALTASSTYQQNLSKCLRSVDHWGTGTGVTDASYAFSYAANLVSVPANIPTTITSMMHMFDGAANFNDANISKWDVSHVTNMVWMFYNASAFNQPLSGWNTSNVNDISWMFYNASAFNQPLSGWNTSKITIMKGVFASAPAVSSASSFNQPLNAWDTSNVTAMTSMFLGASKFNQPLDKWNTSKVTNMDNMFNNATVFNQNIKSTWNVSRVSSSNTFRTGSALTTANSPF